MKDPDRFASRVIYIGWGIIGTFGIAQLITAVRWW